MVLHMPNAVPETESQRRGLEGLEDYPFLNSLKNSNALPSHLDKEENIWCLGK